MNLTTRDKRALAGLALAVVGTAIFLATSGDSGQRVVSASDTVALAERRIARVRATAATVTGKEAVLAQVAAELGRREKGVLQAQTAAQAQAQLLEIVRHVARAQTPPIEFGTVELSQEVKKLGDNYGEVQITVPFLCRVDDLVNFLSDLTKRPEQIATSEMRISAQEPAKQKNLLVRLTVSGVVPQRLVAEKKGPVAF